jgi:NADH-quinone oxidoreductase subunit C
MSPTYGSRYPACDQIRAAVEAAVPNSVLGQVEHRSEITLVIDGTQILNVCRYLRDDQDWRFLLLADIAGIDWPDREKRFDVVYNLYSPHRNLRLRLKVQVAEHEPVPSVVSLWSTANWHEREIYDMFGVAFSGHPDLRRILMPEDWEGHPLRKDFPLSYELPQFTHNLSERPEWLEQGLRWFGNREYGGGQPQTSFPRQGPEGKPVAGWEGRPPEESEEES